MNQQYDLKYILSVFTKKWWAIAVSAVLLAAMAFAYSSFIAVPLYMSTGKLYVNSVSVDSNDSTNISVGTLNASQRLANTCVEILKSRSFLKSVISASKVDITLGRLESSLSIKPANETELLEIKVVSDDPKEAYKLSNTILQMSKDEIIKIIKAGNVEIVDSASLPTVPVSPNTRNNIVIGFILGAVIGAVVVFLLETMNTKIKNRQDLAQRYDIPILGSVPELKIRQEVSNGKKE